MNNGYTGGPAFPLSEDLLRHPDPRHVMGMTIRDYFAAKALGFAMTDPAIIAFTVGAGPAAAADMLAERAYTIADAMLRERAK